MDETEFRNALRTTVSRYPEPPAMESSTALAAGRRARHRRDLLAGGGAVAAILAVTVAVVPAFHPGGGTGIQPAAGPPSQPAPLPAPPDVTETKPSWPAEAGDDATADSGDHFDTGKQLLDDVLAVVPDGYTAPDGKSGEYDYRSHQATIEDGDYWRYMVSVALRKAGRTGGLVVEVLEPGNNLPTDVCEVASRFWQRGGECVPHTVGGRTVGVVHEGTATAWAAYRHPDGTVVYVMQSTATTWGDVAGLKPLSALPLTTPELATLATSDRFR